MKIKKKKKKKNQQIKATKLRAASVTECMPSMKSALHKVKVITVPTNMCNLVREGSEEQNSG